MKITPYAIDKLTAYIIDGKKGREIVSLFNKFGFRDIYDEMGLPDIGKPNNQRPSRTEFAKKRLAELNDSQSLRELLNDFIKNNTGLIPEIQEILHPEKYGISVVNGEYHVQGGVVVKAPPVVNQAHFQDIQNRILDALDSAEVSITLVIAWFTNKVLFQKILEKQKQGVEVKIAIYDDGINKKHGVNIDLVPNVKLKRGVRGGLMHNKFCVIDNQIVITGSYNWSDNAEFKNDENVTVEYDPKQATRYSVEYRRLTKLEATE
ncbi:phospholipase D-like domain-containing protein [Chryseobacterium sp. UNC8MFCol]|uniref:phospholipase D-like domain-containing protein n=1 Tax=Chryseobacterium sp. UNC8MFCol TaxID=1340435 RepID=UPI0004801A33|nr:phospholipase D-like domain-containing protein [Chryseobacterium sp. UNC8MFCol]